MISGNAKYQPSSELKMHLEVYKERPDIKSVVHAHNSRHMPQVLQ